MTSFKDPFLERLKLLTMAEFNAMKEDADSKIKKNIELKWYDTQEKYNEYLRIEKSRPSFLDFEMCYIKFDSPNTKNWKLRDFPGFFIRLILEEFEGEILYEFNGIVMEKDQDGITVIVKRFQCGIHELLNYNHVFWKVGPSDQKIYEWRDGCLDSLSRIDSSNSQIVKKFLGKEKLTLKKDYKHSIFYKKYSEKLEHLNEFQQEAAINTLENDFTLIQGPPGTGKTTTSAAILELLGDLMDDSNIPEFDKILVLADSNKAVDNLTLKLMELMKQNNKPDQVLRIMSFSAQKSDYDKRLNSVCYHHLMKKKAQIEVLDKIRKARFFCCTLDRASKLSKIKDFQGYNFPFSLVDEATQCHELQTIKAISSSTQKFILVGDQCQLGPVFQSREAQKFDISSTFERLVKSKSDWVCLKMQYRMHEDISEISSKLFIKE